MSSIISAVVPVEYVYLLRVFEETKRNIFKFGKTKRHFPERLKEYSKIKPTVLMVLPCSDCGTFERTVLKDINKTFVMRGDIGLEYFEADLDDIQRLITRHYRKLLIDDSSNIPVNDTKHDTQRVINMDPRLPKVITDDLIDLALNVGNRVFVRNAHDHGYPVINKNYENYLNATGDLKDFLGTMLPTTITNNQPILYKDQETMLLDPKINISPDYLHEIILESINRLDYSRFKRLMIIKKLDPAGYQKYMDPRDIDNFCLMPGSC